MHSNPAFTETALENEAIPERLWIEPDARAGHVLATGFLHNLKQFLCVLAALLVPAMQHAFAIAVAQQLEFFIAGGPHERPDALPLLAGFEQDTLRFLDSPGKALHESGLAVGQACSEHEAH